MKQIFTLVTLVMMSIMTYAQQPTNNTTETPTTSNSITDIKIKAEIDGQERVIQQFLLPKFKKDWYFQRFRSWVIDNIVYPQECVDEGVSGRVVVVFIIDADGVIRTTECVQTPDKRLSDELIRVIKSETWYQAAMQWNVEKKHYEAVPIRSMIPITFNLPAKHKESNAHLSYEMMESEFIDL